MIPPHVDDVPASAAATKTARGKDPARTADAARGPAPRRPPPVSSRTTRTTTTKRPASANLREEDERGRNDAAAVVIAARARAKARRAPPRVALRRPPARETLPGQAPKARAGTIPRPPTTKPPPTSTSSRDPSPGSASASARGGAGRASSGGPLMDSRARGVPRGTRAGVRSGPRPRARGDFRRPAGTDETIGRRVERGSVPTSWIPTRPDRESTRGATTRGCWTRSRVGPRPRVHLWRG